MPVNFPNTTDFQDNYQPKDRWSTTLAADLDSTGTIVYLNSTAGLSPKGWVTVDSEHIYYDYIDGNNLGDGNNPVTRGVDGSTAVAHSQGASVAQRINAAAIQNIMDAIKKRKEYTLISSSVAANTTSDQNLTGFVSRAQIHELRISATGGSTQFRIEFYRTDQFKGKERIYETIDLSAVESTVDATSSSGTDKLYIAATTGFLIDEMIHVSGSAEEYAMVEDIVSGDYLDLYDTLENDYAVSDKVMLVHRDQKSFYYEDLDWSQELHVRIINLDTANTVTVTINVIAEVSDGA